MVSFSKITIASLYGVAAVRVGMGGGSAAQQPAEPTGPSASSVGIFQILEQYHIQAKHLPEYLVAHHAAKPEMWSGVTELSQINEMLPEVFEWAKQRPVEADADDVEYADCLWRSFEQMVQQMAAESRYCEWQLETEKLEFENREAIFKNHHDTEGILLRACSELASMKLQTQSVYFEAERQLYREIMAADLPISENQQWADFIQEIDDDQKRERAKFVHFNQEIDDKVAEYKFCLQQEKQDFDQHLAANKLRFEQAYRQRRKLFNDMMIANFGDKFHPLNVSSEE